MDNKNSKLKEGLINFLSVTGDLMALNIIWLICSIPIITIGPATCALYDATLRMAQGDSFPVLKTYFKAFKGNFKQSLIVGAFSIFVAVTIYADINYILAVSGNTQRLFIIVAIVVTAMLLIIATYGYCLIAKYNNNLKGHIINAFKLAFVSPLQTLLIWVITLSPLLVLLLIKPLIILYLGWFFILFFVSLPTYCNSIIINKILKNFNV